MTRSESACRLFAISALFPLLAALVAATPDVSASTACSDELLCINDVVTEDGIECVATNNSDAPITFTLRVSGAFNGTRRSQTVTEVVPPRKSITALSIEPRGKPRRGRYCYNYRSTIGHLDAAHDNDYLYRLPYENGKSYGVLQGYGSRFSHTGREQYAVDFNMPEGTPIYAARGGIVADYEESNSIGCWEDNCGKYANFLVISHEDGTTGEYYHLLKDGVLVERGDRIMPGQKIALSGNTGHTTMPHLHFGVYRPEPWGRYQSIPVRFISADGIVDRPRRGGRYQAISLKQANRKYGDIPSVYQYTNQESTL